MDKFRFHFLLPTLFLSVDTVYAIVLVSQEFDPRYKKACVETSNTSLRLLITGCVKQKL